MISIGPLENWLWRSRRTTGVLVALILVIGLVATGINATLQYNQITAQHRQRFQSLADIAMEQTSQQLRNDIALLHGLAALFHASTSVEREDFRAYVLTLGLEQNFPGVAAVGFLPDVTAADIPELAARAAREGIPGFDTPAPVRPMGERLAPVWYVEPFSGLNVRLTGRDFLADPVLAEALGQARRSGLAAMSGPVRLVREWPREQPPSVVLFYPVYRQHDPDVMSGRHNRAVTGFAFVVLQVPAMLAGKGEKLGVDLEVFDGPRPDPTRLLFDEDGHRLADGGYPGRFAEHVDTLVFAQRTWTLYAGSLPAFEAGADFLPVYILAGAGVLNTLLAALLIDYLGSGRRRAENLARTMTERLRERNQELTHTINELEYQKSVLDNHAIVSTTDYRGNITYVNDRFCEISGFRREELLGQNHRIVKSARHPGAFFESMWATIASGEIWEGEICNRTRDGREYWVKTTIVPFLDEHGVPERYVSARTDITALKQARDELQRQGDRLHELVEERTRELLRAKEQAEAASQAKSQFLANMSHELRTPIHAVLSYSELGESKAERTDFTGDKARNYFHRIHQSGRRLLGLINDLLDLSKMEAGRMRYEMRPSDMRRVFDRVGDDLSSLLAAKRIQLDLAGCPVAVPVVLDPMRMEQVVINLLSNAIRFSPEGGVIRIRCQAAEMRGRRAGDAPCPGLRVCVADQGPGIPEAELESVFDTFVQASHSRSGAGGTGLGLAICREIVGVHRGRIWAENNPEGGACLVFEFPADLPVTTA